MRKNTRKPNVILKAVATLTSIGLIQCSNSSYTYSASLTSGRQHQIQPTVGGITLEIPVEDAAVTNFSVCQALVSNLQVKFLILLLGYRSSSLVHTAVVKNYLNLKSAASIFGSNYLLIIDLLHWCASTAAMSCAD
jgi:hypothetical protein